MLAAIRKRLSAKILIVTAATMVALLGALSWATVRDHRSTERALEQRTNESFATFVYNTLLLSMMEGRMTDLQRLLESAAGTAGIESLRVLRPDGTVGYSGRIEEVGAVAPDPLLSQLLEQGRGAAGMVEARRAGIVYHAAPLHNPERGRCFGCHQGDGPYLGAIVMGFDLSEYQGKIETSRRRQAIGLAVAVGLVVAVVYLCLRLLVLGPLFRVVEGAQRMAHGDLSQSVAVSGTDEMADLASHLNTLRAHLREGIEESSTVAEALAEAVEELDGSSERLVGISVEQSSGAAEQASAVQEATTTAEEIAATSNEISANVEAVEQVAEETYNASVHGREAVRLATAGMAEVKEHVTGIADAMLGLGKKSQKIGGVVDIIDEISEQTHLLALNAAIEAAGAGEHGKRFGVVAAEIRRLAERTVEATTQIKSLIEEIQDSTNDTVMATERGTVIVMEGADRVDRIGESLEGILALVRQTKESAKEITIATQQQATAGEQLVLTITDINEVAVQVNRSAEQVEKSVIRLKDLARRLKELAEANRTARKFTV